MDDRQEHQGLSPLHHESLSQVTSHLLEECRMVLPGIQALFGFQLIAVFNGRFWELPNAHRILHLVAVGFVALSIALVMTPAAYHRIALQNAVSQRFIDLSSKLLLCSMVPLLLGICLDVYLVATMILGSTGWGVGLSLTLAGIFGGLWIVLPYRSRASVAHDPFRS